MAKRKRELIKFENEEEFVDLLFNSEFGECEDYEYVEDNIVYFDLEKGYAELRVVVQRNIDKKFFAGNYYDGGCGDRWATDTQLEEVFPVNRVITKFE